MSAYPCWQFTCLEWMRVIEAKLDMATMMRAALDDGSGVYRTQDVPMPEMFEGAAMIRVRQTGICGSDLHMTNSRQEAQDVPSGH